MSTYPFFVIDSNNLEDVSQQLYGYTLCDMTYEEFVSCESIAETWTNGCFVLVQCSGEKIIVSQDNVGAFGLYLYKQTKNAVGAETRFIMSNSFTLLEEYLRDQKIPFRVNTDFCSHLIASGYSTASCAETPAKEIECLPRTAYVVIDRGTGELGVQYKHGVQETIPLGTRASVALLDMWYEKWKTFLEALYQEGNLLKVDITGGFDSRAALAILLGADIPTANLVPNTWSDKSVRTHVEDLQISEEIKKYYGFPLGDDVPSYERIPRSLKATVASSFYPKLGFHGQMFFNSTRTEKPLYHLRGMGGELSRDYKYETDEQIIEGFSRLLRGRFPASAEKLIAGYRVAARRTHDGVDKIYGKKLDDTYYGHVMFKETYNRAHFGKWMVEDFLANTITLAPMEDFSLHKIRNFETCPDALIALIFLRYMPKLIEFGFDCDRSLPEEALSLASQINETYPVGSLEYPKETMRLVVEEGYENMLLDSDLSLAVSEESGLKRSPYKFCKDEFHSEKTLEYFRKVFPEEVYEYAHKRGDQPVWQPLDLQYAVLAIAKIIADSRESMSS